MKFEFTIWLGSKTVTEVNQLLANLVAMTYAEKVRHEVVEQGSYDNQMVSLMDVNPLMNHGDVGASVWARPSGRNGDIDIGDKCGKSRSSEERGE